MKPYGNPMFVVRVITAAGIVTAVTGYRCNGSLSIADWTSLGPLAFTWIPLTQQLQVAFDVCWNCVMEKSIPYYQHNATDISAWERYNKTAGSDWSMNPSPPTCKHYNLTIYLGAIIQPGPAGEIWLLWVCGPRGIQGIPPKVIGVTPV